MLIRSITFNRFSAAYASNIIVASNPVILLGFTIYNSGAAQFIQLHNVAALPDDDEVPEVMFPVASASVLPAYWGPEGRFFSNGLVICNSTLPTAKAIGSADCWFDVQVAIPVER